VVALENGVPDKKRYRTYHVRGRGEGDDYASIYEVLSRRFRRGRDALIAANAERVPSEAAPSDAVPSEAAPSDAVPSEAAPSDAVPSQTVATEKEMRESDAAWDLPDLVVVDGGRGQLAVALAAAHDLGLHDLAIVGLAKEKETPLGDKLVDRVYLPGQKNPIPLRPNTPELFLLARARDEAHRFSNRGRKVVGKRRNFASELDSVPGIGPKVRTALLIRFGSIAAIHAATDDQLLQTERVTRRHVAALRRSRETETETETESLTLTEVEAPATPDATDASGEQPEREDDRA
jgi:excinuclease ABC subunit C